MARAREQGRARDDLRSLLLHELNEDAAIGHHLLARPETLRNVVTVAAAIAQRHMPAGKTAVGLGDKDEWKILLVTQDGGNRHEKAAYLLAGENFHLHIHLAL